MIYYYEGTVFNTKAKTLVNTVNCHGVMGTGIALEFKLRFPNMFDDYVNMCEKKEMRIGWPRLYKHSDELWILNFPTKNHWKNPSKLSYIEEGLKYFVENYQKANIDSIAFPKLGAGNGGLDWDEVKVLMEKYLRNLDIDIYICLDSMKEPAGVEEQMISMINSCSSDILSNQVHLSQKQLEKIQKSLPIRRFMELSKVNGISQKVYTKTFTYFYEKSVLQTSSNFVSNKSELIEGEQLSLF